MYVRAASYLARAIVRSEAKPEAEFASLFVSRLRGDGLEAVDPVLRLRELFLYGQAVHQWPSAFLGYDTDCMAAARAVYTASTRHAYKAAVAVLAVARSRRGARLTKDVALLLAQHVFALRVYPADWGVSESDLH